MPIRVERVLSVLRGLLRSAHLAGADDLPVLVAAAGGQLTAERAVLYLVDYDQLELVPLHPPAGPAAAAATVPIEGTLAGRSFTDVRQHTGTTSNDRRAVWTPVVDGSERLGVLLLDFAADVEVDDELRAACRDVADLVAELVVTRSLYGDAVERARRRTPMTIPAEMQWRLLPPLTLTTRRVAIAGGLAPTAEVAGDSFDYALNGDIAHVAIFDAMGHGMEAALLAAVAISTLRNSRRGGLDLSGTVRRVDTEIAAQFGPDKFLTGIIGELNLVTGCWSWSSCGHPPALLLRGGRVVKTLDTVIGAPLGLGLLSEHPEIGEERLQPGDRLLLYTDGVVEARDQVGEFFGTERLVEFTTRQAAAGRPAAETLRRLNHTILRHQQGKLQDDATTVLIEWLTGQPSLGTP